MGKALLILTPVIFVAHKLVPALMLRVQRAANPEFFVLVALALAFMTAALTHAVDCHWLWAPSSLVCWSANQLLPTRPCNTCSPCAMPS